MKKVFGNRNVVIARELTKKYEEYIRGTLDEVVEEVKELKGEIVVLVEGASKKSIVINLNNMTVLEHYKHYIDLGYKENDAMKMVAKDRGVAKNIIYKEIKC